MSVISLLKSYIGWHYSLALEAWWLIYTNCLWFLFNFFSVSILIRTLFSPWRRLTESYPTSFAPGAAAEILIINLLMRAVGLVIRTVFIFFAAWFSPLWPALATVVAWFQPRLPEITGATLIFLALWLVVYLLEAFFRQRYFSIRTAAGPSFDAGRILFNTLESDLVIALLTAPAGAKWLIRLGLTPEQGAEFLTARRPKKISLPFEPKLLNSLP